jgi:hypothetical protein
MDFQELNKKINDSEYQYNEQPDDSSGVIGGKEYQKILKSLPKAHGGDRASNLEAIADAIHKRLENIEETLGQDGYSFPAMRGTGIQVEFHKLRGYAEQLRIIADELRRWHGPAS